MSARVLVVDDDQSMCDLVQDALDARDFAVVTTTRGEEALGLLKNEEFDVVVTDLELGGMHGLEVCERIVANRPDIPVVVITAYGSMDTAIAAIRVGAHDFINKPVEMSALAHAVQRAAQHKELTEEVRRLRESVAGGIALEEFVGESAAMRRVYELIRQVSGTDAPVLITGESGTGKELVARALHRHSARRDGAFVAINCAAMPATLLESELFGHVRGAFTDAKDTREGLFVEASGGTLFLDEIGEMPLEMQPKLLRVLQESKVRPVGSNTEVAFDTRVISSTNRDLESEIEEGGFREDLFYRINVVGIPVPPLRSRGRDILLLAQHFLDRVAARAQKAVSGISRAAAQKLLEYDWPGNVRELENCVERAVTLTKFEEIAVDDLPEKVSKYESTAMIIAGADPDEMPTLEEVERRYVRRVLKAVGGNKTHAARVLGLDRRTLYRRLERFDES
jgi:DNA-binding NtrC family response regulator